MTYIAENVFYVTIGNCILPFNEMAFFARAKDYDPEDIHNELHMRDGSVLKARHIGLNTTDFEFGAVLIGDDPIEATIMRGLNSDIQVIDSETGSKIVFPQTNSATKPLVLELRATKEEVLEEIRFAPKRRIEGLVGKQGKLIPASWDCCQ